MLACALPSANGFALLGPKTAWMTTDLGYYAEDAGGPMLLGEGYRWNVPVVTYGFDQSFLDYFGQPGVDAIEQAIQVINDLPRASDMVLTNYDLDTRRFNGAAAAAQLLDLKSVTLPFLLEQLGLTSPTRYMWTMRRWDATAGWFMDGLDETSLINDGFIPYYGVKRNYDPFSLEDSSYVNETLYSCYLHLYGPNLSQAALISFPVDPMADSGSAVCDGYPSFGLLYHGLTRDDAGGLLYLLNRTNITVEDLDEMTTAAPGNTNKLVRVDPRPGVEKITFVRQFNNSAGGFVAMTNQFADVYFTNGVQSTQMVQRVTTTPDFIFSARDLGFQLLKNYQGNPYFVLTSLQRTGAANWSNNSALNYNPGGDGPGTIHGPVRITFQMTDKYLSAAGGVTNTATYGWNWGSFSNISDPIVFQGRQTNVTSLTLATKTITTNGAPMLQWTVLGHQGATYRIETSTNLTDWSSAGEITNTNGIFVFQSAADQPVQYFRTILE
jgi:hypothetical protein